MPGYRRGLTLRDAVVGVTRAAGPLGAATAAALAGRGARPVLLDAPGVDLGPVLARCGGRGTAVAVDLRDPDGVRDAVAGLDRLDGWVQLPGPGPAGGLLDLPGDTLRAALDGDVLGALHAARAAVPRMVAGGGGVFVVVASVHAQVARPFGAVPGLAAAALRVMAAALRQELRRDGVRGVAVTTVLAPPVAPDPGRPVPAAPADRVAATVLGQLRHPRLEKVAAGPLTTALVHGHALVPGLTEWLVARRSPRP